MRIILSGNTKGTAAGNGMISGHVLAYPTPDQRPRVAAYALNIQHHRKAA